MQTQSAASEASAPTPSTPPIKFLVAVHGIGDQVGYATAQAVAAQIGVYYDIAAAIPLGRFYTATGGVRGRPAPILMVPPQDPRQFDGIGFAEVYWAQIPRKVVTRGHILEESKRWARTVSGRLTQRAMLQNAPIPRREQVRLTTVLHEMIETIAVLERVNFLLAKAGMFKFNLNELLTDFLGDVQIVADFQAYRDEILTSFGRVMNDALALASERGADLHLIAHSEGSVIAFLALISALSEPDRHPWIRSVRGVMTIGSPIEIHHLLWPELWQHLSCDERLKAKPLGIPWHNYYDFGDPIAYALHSTGEWLKVKGFDDQLKLTETGFGRSYLPGKAHVDYWEDDQVFGHFIDTVVRPSHPSPRSAAAAVPGSKWSAIAMSYAVPQALIAALLCAATYLLYRPVAGLVVSPLSPLTVFRDVLGISTLLLGVTAATRIPRLTNKWRWWLLAAGLLVGSMFVYQEVAVDRSRAFLGRTWIEPSHRLAPTADDIARATLGVQAVAGGLALVCGVLASWWPTWGVRILPLAGLAATLALIAGFLLRDASSDAELWPVVLGAAGFFYLWWLATLLFDLVFVWHRYIRHGTALHSVAEISKRGYVKSKFERLTARKVDARKS